jgi:hypothetical protein
MGLLYLYLYPQYKVTLMHMVLLSPIRTLCMNTNQLTPIRKAGPHSADTDETLSIVLCANLLHRISQHFRQLSVARTGRNSFMSLSEIRISLRWFSRYTGPHKFCRLFLFRMLSKILMKNSVSRLKFYLPSPPQ